MSVAGYPEWVSPQPAASTSRTGTTYEAFSARTAVDGVVDVEVLVDVTSTSDVGVAVLAGLAVADVVDAVVVVVDRAVVVVEEEAASGALPAGTGVPEDEPGPDAHAAATQHSPAIRAIRCRAIVE